VEVELGQTGLKVYSKGSTPVGKVRAMGWARVALVLAAVLLVAGCGSKKSAPQTPADWANGVCNAGNTWVTSMKSSVNSVTSGSISKSSIQGAADDIKSATDTLESDLKALGKPNTTSGQQARDSLDQLSSELQTDVDSIKSAVNSISSLSSATSAASTTKATLTKMKDQVSSTVTELKQLDVGGELQTAFKQSSACTKLKNQLSTLSG
jgi:hypothetical protein